MDIQQTRLFVAIAEEKSISKAAQRCFISHQGASAALARLEKELNVALFNRTTSGIVPTQYAESLLPYAMALITQHDTMLVKIRNLKAGASRPILGFSPGLFMDQDIVSHIDLHRWCNESDLRRLDIVCQNATKNRKMLLAGELDAAAECYFEPPDPSLFDSFPLRNRATWVAFFDDTVQSERMICPSELAGYKIPCEIDDYCCAELITRVVSPQLPNPIIDYCPPPNFYFFNGLTRNHAFVAWDSVVKSMHNEHARIFPLQTSCEIKEYFLWRKGEELNLSLQALVAWLRQEYQSADAV